METLFQSLQQTLGAHLPAILGALAILIAGWIIAVAARAGTRTLLTYMRVNNRIKESTEQAIDVESPIALGVFWLIILITLVGVFNSLDLQSVSNPFAAVVTQILGYLPRLIGGVVLLLIVWVIATALRALVNRALTATTWDEKLSKQAGMEPMSKSVSNVLFWLVILLFIPAILGAFQLEGLLEPVRAMVNKMLDILPNVFAACVIAFVGWLVAKVLRGLVTNLLLAAGADRLGKSAGLDPSVQISRLAGMLVFIFVFVPTLIAALDALRIEAVSRPATEMLGKMLDAIPHVLAAAVILTLTYYIAKFVSSLAAQLLTRLGFDALPQKLGIGNALSGALKPSTLVGALILFFAMLFATVEAANQLGFSQVRDVITAFIKFGGDLMLGGLILIVGFWLAGLAHRTIVKANPAAANMARIAQLAILGLVLAMGLRAMGIANEIVQLGFGLTLGAIAIAVALSFGLGGREAAGKQMEYWLGKLRK